MNREDTLQKFEYLKLVLTEPLTRFTERPLKDFTIKSDLFRSSGIEIEEVDKIFDDSQDKPDVRGDKREPSDGETEANPTKQDRYKAVMKVLMTEFGYDPAEKVKHDLKKIRSESADRYLIKFQFRGEPLCMVVTDWYGYAVYIMKEKQYSKSFKPSNRLQNGVARFYWLFEENGTTNSEKVFDALTAKIREKLDKLVP